MNRPGLHILAIAAHTLSIAIAGIFLIFAVGEIWKPHSGPPSSAAEVIGLLLIATVCCAPILAWRHELAAAILSLCALAGFCAIAGFSAWLIIAVLALPGVLHLAHALLTRPGHSLPTIG